MREGLSSHRNSKAVSCVNSFKVQVAVHLIKCSSMHQPKLTHQGEYYFLELYPVFAAYNNVTHNAIKSFLKLITTNTHPQI